MLIFKSPIISNFAKVGAALCDFVTLPVRATIHDAKRNYQAQRIFYGEKATPSRVISTILDGATVPLAFTIPVLPSFIMPVHQVYPQALPYIYAAGLLMGYTCSWKWMGVVNRRNFERFPLLRSMQQHSNSKAVP